MPRRWTLLLRDHADAARPLRPSDCHGLLNRWWPQSPAEHVAAKPWTMNGPPEPIGDRLWHWTLTWLDDHRDPPLPPPCAVGHVHRIGDHLMEPLSATEVAARGYPEILAGVEPVVGRAGADGTTGPAEARNDTGNTGEAGTARPPQLPAVSPRAATLHARAPVLTVGDDGAGRRQLCDWPTPRQLFGFVHHFRDGRRGGSGAVGAVAQFAPPELAAAWLPHADEVIARLDRFRVADHPIHRVRVPGPGGRPVVGWLGAIRLTLPGTGGGPELAALLELVELAGVGKYTAQGFGAVRVDSVTVEPPEAAPARGARPRPRRRPERRDRAGSGPARAPDAGPVGGTAEAAPAEAGWTDDDAGEFDGVLFD